MKCPDLQLVLFVFDKAGIQSKCTNIRSNDTEDLWLETQANPIETFLIVHLCGEDLCDRTRIQGLKCFAKCLQEIVVMVYGAFRIYHGLVLSHVVHPPPTSACQTSCSSLLPFHSLNYFSGIDVFVNSQNAVCHCRIVHHRFSEWFRRCPKGDACQRMVENARVLGN